MNYRVLTVGLLGEDPLPRIMIVRAWMAGKSSLVVSVNFHKQVTTQTVNVDDGVGYTCH